MSDLKEQLEKYRWNNMSKSCHEDDYIDGFNDCLNLLLPLVEACEDLSEDINQRRNIGDGIPPRTAFYLDEAISKLQELKEKING